MEGSNIAYTAVEAYSLDPSNSRIISGGNQGSEVITGDIRFLWSFDPETGDGGFTGVSWFSNIPNSPLAIAGKTEQQIESELTNGTRTDLNDVFSAWQSFINSNPETDYVNNFVSELVLEGARSCWATIS